jgi:hypothetical protein
MFHNLKIESFDFYFGLLKLRVIFKNKYNQYFYLINIYIINISKND